MTNLIRIDRDAILEMRDGIKICADIYRPDDGGRHPAILMRSYSKDLISAQPSTFFYLIHAGYAIINSDLRGRGKSEGQWDPSKNEAVEGRDGYDSVEFIAAQPWCDGNVGMAGLSHMGSFEWFTATQKPPHLKAIAPWTTDFCPMFVPPRTGGAISFITTIGWLPQVLKDLVDKLDKAGKDVTGIRRCLQWAQDYPQEFYNFLPLDEVPLAKFGSIQDIWRWRLHPMSQAELETHRLYEKVTLPCFHECGWFDGVGWVEFENFAGMCTRGGSQEARKSQHIIAGPWPHGWQFQATLGDLSFGAQADTLGSEVNKIQIAFFDRYLRGKDIGIPRVRYFLMGKNEWYNADTWPLPSVTWQRFCFHSRGKANTSGGDGLLSRNEPGSETPDTFKYQPLDPVPTVGGPIIVPLAAPGMVAGALDQHHIEKRADVLCYSTPELEQDIEITGPLQVHLFAATSVRDTDFTTKFCDVYPDGRSYNLAEGLMRASGLKFAEKPELINPGEPYEYVITLGNTSQLFRKGHRIRIQISSSNFPLFDRNMNTGNEIGKDKQGVVAIQTVFHQPGYVSYLDLPVIDHKKII
jgi:putative CocE/NonD family hydrolase